MEILKESISEAGASPGFRPLRISPRPIRRPIIRHLKVGLPPAAMPECGISRRIAASRCGATRAFSFPRPGRSLPWLWRILRHRNSRSSRSRPASPPTPWAGIITRSSRTGCERYAGRSIRSSDGPASTMFASTPPRSSNGRSLRAPDWDGSAGTPCSSIRRSVPIFFRRLFSPNVNCLPIRPSPSTAAEGAIGACKPAQPNASFRIGRSIRAGVFLTGRSSIAGPSRPPSAPRSAAGFSVATSARPSVPGTEKAGSIWNLLFPPDRIFPSGMPGKKLLCRRKDGGLGFLKVLSAEQDAKGS